MHLAARRVLLKNIEEFLNVVRHSLSSFKICYSYGKKIKTCNSRWDIQALSRLSYSLFDLNELFTTIKK